MLCLPCTRGDEKTYMQIYVHLNFVVVSDFCTVELVGSIEVMGNTATYAFRGVGSGITGYVCKLNGDVLPDCK